jgi:Protein of unknown function (DUF3224)
MKGTTLSCLRIHSLWNFIFAFGFALVLPVYANSQAIDPLAGTVHVKQPAASSPQTASISTQTVSATTQPATAKDTRAMQHAHGSFDVKVTPLTLYDKTAPSTLSRRAVERQIHGDFEGTSKGEMLVAKTNVDGSEAYCAMEYISGTLKGRKGSFTLQHKGLMIHGKLDIVLSVVPDSGTGELTGLDGILKIDVANGKHFYDLAYTLPSAKK